MVRNWPPLTQFETIQQQIKSYDEHIGKSKSSTSGLKPLKGWGYFVGDIFNYTGEELNDILIGFPGLVDNFGDLLFDLRTAKLSKEDAERLLKKSEDLKKQAGDARETVIKKKDSVACEYHKTDSKVSNATPTLPSIDLPKSSIT